MNPVTPTHTPRYQATSGLLSSPYHHGMLSAHKPLVVPMLLKISQLRLRGIMTLVVDQWRGVTLSFKNDPLESVQVNSTFDDLTSVKKTLQNEIEKHLRELFVEELPALIHTLSLKQMGLREQSVEEVLLRKSSHHHHHQHSGEPNNEDRKQPMLSSGASGTGATADSMDSGLGQSMDDGMYGGGFGGGGSSLDVVRDSLDSLAAFSSSQELEEGFRYANIEGDGYSMERWTTTTTPPPASTTIATSAASQSISLLSAARASPERNLAAAAAAAASSSGVGTTGFSGGASLRSLSPNPRSILFASLPSLRPTAVHNNHANNMNNTTDTTPTTPTSRSAPGSPLRRRSAATAAETTTATAAAAASPTKQQPPPPPQRGTRRSVPLPTANGGGVSVSVSASGGGGNGGVAAPPVHYLMKPALSERGM